MGDSYYLYQKYIKIGDQDPHPAYPVEYSVDGNGTLQKVLKMEDDPNCDVIDTTIYQWVIVAGEYVCSGTTKCQKEKEQKSEDFGQTWTDTGNYRAGAVIEYNSEDCGWQPPQYRTVSGTPYCDGYTKMFDTWNQVSYDGGQTWENTGVSGSTVLEYNSEDCGYIEPIYRWFDIDIYECTNAYEAQLFTLDILSSGYIQTSWNANIVGLMKNLIWSNNGRNWYLLENEGKIHVNAGEKLYFRYHIVSTNIGTDNALRLGGSTASFNAYGNAMSLYYESDFINHMDEYKIFDSLFANTNIVSAENLVMPATSSNYNMFYGCTSLTTPPEKIGGHCQNMFYGCTNLTTAPELTTPTLTDNCYRGMFEGCTSLQVAPILSATTLANECYRSMFAGCASLTTAPSLPATTLTAGCYCFMFQGCTSLTTAPALPATEMATVIFDTDLLGCYQSMFEGCTSLMAAPTLSSTTLKHNCYKNMFKGCTNLTTAPELPATILYDSCYMAMFSGCTSLTTAPDLPATSIPTYGYQYMFKDCANLSHIKCMATDISGFSCVNGWVENVASSGLFIKNSSMESWERGNNGIPNNWTIQNASS